VRRVLAAAVIAAAGTWAVLAACGMPCTACAWLSGAAAVAGGTVAARRRPARPGGPAHLAVLGFLASIVTGSGQLAALAARFRYAAAYRYLASADRHAADSGVTSVELRPGRLVRPLISPQPKEVEASGQE